MAAIAPAVPAAPPHTFVDTISARWDAARAFYRVLLPIRFSFLTVVVFAIALVSNQGKDAIAALAEGNATWTRSGIIGIQVLFVVLIALFATQIWYWSRQLLRVQFRGQPDPFDWPLTASIVPRFLGVAVFVVAIAMLGVVRSDYDGVSRKPANILLGIMIALGIEAAVFVFLVILRRKRIGALQPVTSLKEFGPLTLRILGLTVALAIILLLGSTFAVHQISRIGTVSILVISLALWVALGGMIVYGGMKARIPILTWLLIFAIAISPLADNHKVRTLPGKLPQRPTADVAFDAWCKRLVTEPGSVTAPRPVFIVVTEGGGIRAAYWTAAVLSALSDTIPGFTSHLFAVSGVSGGSVGAATYRALLAENPSGGLRARASEALAYDALAPAISAFTQQDFVQRFLPFRFPDRARALEEGWERGWRNAVKTSRFEESFLATTSKGSDHLPSLFLNSTIVESGGRAITSNVQIDHRFARAIDSLDAIGADVRMSTAAHNSARFPYVSPVGTMMNSHIADGGYFENSGAGTAAELLELVRQHDEYKKGNIRAHVIVIATKQNEQTSRPNTFANEIGAPVLALFNTRSAHAREAVSGLRGRVPPNDRITTFTLVPHKGQRFPLGWLLAARTRDQMDRQMCPDSPENKQAIQAIAVALDVAPIADEVCRRATSNELQAQAEEKK